MSLCWCVESLQPVLVNSLEMEQNQGIFNVDLEIMVS